MEYKDYEDIKKDHNRLICKKYPIIMYWLSLEPLSTIIFASFPGLHSFFDRYEQNYF